MFESEERLRHEILGLLEAMRGLARSRFACLLDPERALFESAVEEGGEWVLRSYLEKRLAALFRIPRALADEMEFEDVFGEWESPPDAPPDEFLLAFLNGRVLLVVVCAEAEALQGPILPPLRALADRLFRWNPAFRLDEKGRGWLFARPKLDLVVIGRPRP